MPDTLPDIDRLEAVYNHILADPVHHDQEIYGSTTPCGAVHCFAGWALVLFGQPNYCFDGQVFREASGRSVNAGVIAGELLGLDPSEAFGGCGRLFGTATSLETIRWWIDHYRAEVGLPPREFRTDLDIDLMEQVWDQICEHPELHDQWDFAQETPCGTAHCFGGWSLVLTGWTVDADDIWHAPDGAALSAFDTAYIARSRLGLTFEEAWTRPGLFEVDMTPPDIRRGIDLLRVKAGLPKRVDAPAYRAD